MKIGLVCPYNLWGGGGVQELVLALRSELSSRGHDVKIITPLPSAYKGKIKIEPYVLTAGMSANVKAFSNTQTQFSASTDGEEIQEMLDKEKFDVLHIHEPSIPIVNRQILVRSTSANVATCHAHIPDRITSKAIINMFGSYTRGLTKYIHAYSAVSGPASEYIRNFTNEEIHIIPNGIDLAKYQTAKAGKKPANLKTILYVGRLEKRKGVKYLLKAFKQLAEKDKNVELVIAGDGPLRARLEEWVKLNRVHRVRFLGFVEEKKKLELLKSADIFCSPAIYGESFGIVLLESMAVNLPIVAGDNPGYASVMQGKGAESLVDSLNINEFVKKLDMFLYDTAKRQEWQKWSQDYVKQFDYQNVVDEYEKFYKLGLKEKHENSASSGR